MQATSEDPIAAQLMGIPIKKIYALVWIFSALVATLSGVLLAPRIALLDTSMGFLGLKAFPAAVLGGFGSIPGAIVGGVILGVIETISLGTLSFHFDWIKEINDIKKKDGAFDELFKLKEEGLTKAVGLAMGKIDIMFPMIKNWDFDVLINHNRYTLLNREANDKT